VIDPRCRSLLPRRHCRIRRNKHADAEPALPRSDRLNAAQWLLAARIRHARILFETTVLSVERIASASATATAIGSATAMRARFAQTLGTSSLRYRQAFRQSQG
jgi:hypothetical protein